MATRRPDDPKLSRQRQRVAEAAGRLLATGEQTDPDRARRKAAEQLGVRREAELPSGDEVREAALAYRRLFVPADPSPLLRAQREAALEAMQFLATFLPRLTGEVLRDGSDAQTPVCLHLHADSPDDVARFLHDHRITADQGQRRMRLDRDCSAECPLWSFQAGSVAFELLVLPHSSLRQAPLDPLDGQPQARASVSALMRLLGR